MSVQQAIIILFNEAKATYFNDDYKTFLFHLIKSYESYQKNNEVTTDYTIDEWLVKQAQSL